MIIMNTWMVQRCLWIFLLSALFFPADQVFSLTLDTAFGTKGIVTTKVGHFTDKAHAVIVQPDGKILVAGSSSNSRNLDFALVRYTANGELDPSFHFNGQTVTVVGSEDDAALDIALQSDGKIITCGYTFNGEDRDFAMLRFMADGTLDRDFGTNGMVVLPIGNGNDRASSVAVQSDGMILLAGTVEGTVEPVGAVVRFSTDGAVDSSFGQGGMIFIDAGGGTELTDMTLQKDKRIVLVGSHEEGGRKQILLARRLSSGLPDPHFGDAGVAEAVAENRESAAYGLTVLEDGAILVAGSVGVEHNQDVALVCFTSAGRLDHEFGTSSGMLIHDFKGEADVAYGLAATASTIFVTGYMTADGLRDMFLLQYPLTEDQPASPLVVSTGMSPFAGAAYSLALQAEEKVVLAGVSEDAGVSSFAVVQYTVTELDPSVDPNAAFVSPFIMTTPVTDITRVGGLTGGTISADSGLTFTRRGVVYSIAPYPSLPASTVSTTTVSVTVIDTTKEGFTSNGSGVGVFGSILSGLSSGTQYFVRAYGVTSQGIVYYGQQQSFTTSDACFIATAAYGSLLDPHVQTLRLFRDSYLLTCGAGRAFVRCYYQYSPPIAELVAHHAVLRCMVRILLLPVITGSYLVLHFGIMGMSVGMSVGMGAMVACGAILVARRRSRSGRCLG